MTWIPRCLSYVALAAAGSLCGAAGALRQVHSRTIGEHHGAIPNAYLIAKPLECDGLFDALLLFDRPAVGARVHFDGIYVIGTGDDSATVASVARAHGIRGKVHRADAALVLQRRALGYRGAVLVVTDARERVVLARSLLSRPDPHIALGELLAAPL
jgi:hypothetical protein